MCGSEVLQVLLCSADARAADEACGGQEFACFLLTAQLVKILCLDNLQDTFAPRLRPQQGLFLCGEQGWASACRDRLEHKAGCLEEAARMLTGTLVWPKKKSLAATFHMTMK